LEDFQGNSKFYTWLVRIAVNQSLMKLRKRKTDASVSLDDPVDTGEENITQEIAVWEPNPEQTYSREEIREILVKAVDGLPPAPHEVRRAVESPSRDFTAREALRTRAFWLISLGHGFALLVVHAVNVHAITHMTQDLGYTLEHASLAYTLLPLSQMGGVAVGWLIGDRYEKRYIAATCMLMHMAALLLLTYAVNLAMVLAFAVLHGGGWGLRGPFMQAIRADYFGRSAIGMILGLSLMIIVVGQVGGPMIAGVLADLTGNYRVGFTIIAALALIGALFFILARKPPRPLAQPVA
jgi:sugar phosphate permease